jgi:hypothetical protein
MRSSLVGNVQLAAGNAEAIPAVLALLETEGISTRANPDVYVRAYQRFGIDEARELSERASSRAIAADRRVFIVAAPVMTADAQNALLKTIEEPPGDALFFFIVPSPQTLLATFRSRAQVVEVRAPDVFHEGSVDAKKFLAATPSDRLDMLKPLLEKDADDKRDQGAIITFLSSVERRLGNNPDGLRALYRARKYIGDKGALVKPLLEQLALLV